MFNTLLLIRILSDYRLTRFGSVPDYTLNHEITHLDFVG